MKSGIVLFFFCLLFCCNSFGQKASYSHQNCRVGYQDVVQLIANVSNRHHLLLIRPKKTPFIYVYDESLRLLGIKEIPVSFSDNCDVQILALKNQYFIYIRIPKTSKYQLWKIDDNGNVNDMLPLFRKLADAHFKDPDATVQLMVDKDKLYLRTQVYYPQLGKLKITMVATDTMLNVSAVDYISLPFNTENENLQLVSLLDNENILILKRLQNENDEDLLEVMKCNFKTGNKEAIRFNVSHGLFAQPAMHFNPDDSTITVYSMIRESLLNSGYHRSLFMCKLNKALQPVSQVASLKTSNLFSFFMISDLKMNWLQFIDTRLSISGRTSNWKGWELPESNNRYVDYNISQRFSEKISDQQEQMRQQSLMKHHEQLRNGPYQNDIYYSNRNRIRFSILDQHLNVVSDSAMLIDNEDYIINVSNFGKFHWGNRSYLIMEQQLPNKSTGLLLITSKGDKKVDITNLHVYNRYNYSLSQLQQGKNGSIIIPYTHEEEVGLMRLSLN